MLWVLTINHKHRLPSLTALRAFEAAARLKKFTAAANELCVSRSAISHQIKRLEAELAVRLFQRSGSTLQLTSAGQLLLPIVRDAFEQIRRGAQLVGQTKSSALTFQVYATVAVKWLIPHIHRLYRRHPKLSLRLLTSILDWEFQPEQADVGLIYLRGPQKPQLYYRRLFKAMIFPVCSPTLVSGKRALKVPADLAKHELLGVYTDSGNWAQWLGAVDLASLADRPGVQLDTYLLAYEAAVAGQGVAISSGPFAADDLRIGRLVRPFQLAVPEPGAWYLVYPNTLRNDPRLDWLETWLLELIENDENINKFIIEEG